MGPEAVANLARLRSDYAVYAPVALKIKSKNPLQGLMPFTFNAAQRYVHQRIEQQLRETGKVRAIILKGRQQGISTYVEGRFYWKTSGMRGVKTYILTHEQKATDNLFAMAKRYHDNVPAVLKPRTKFDNAKELVFDLLDSSYKVATANSDGTGRSDTAHLFHGSEMAFWRAAQDHMSGLGQVISDEPGTEIILESTANGHGNLFHTMWQDAVAGRGSYIAIFVPWFWQAEYRTTPPPDWAPTAEEIEYRELHGLDLDQIYWRHLKIIDSFSGDELRFQQEYPATADEAFVAVGIDSYIKAKEVVLARKHDTPAPPPRGALIIGVDPARSEAVDADDTAIIRRRGRHAYGLERLHGWSTMQVAGRIVRIIQDEKVDHVFMDVGGLGIGIHDRLVELGWGHKVTAVNFGSTEVNDPVRYVNRRSEMWGEMRAWLRFGPVRIPDDNGLHADLTAPQYRWSSNGALLMEKKEDMKKRGIRSPDSADALALTFAEPVAAPEKSDASDWRKALLSMEDKALRGDNSHMAV